MVVVSSVLSEESCTWWTLSLACDLELDDHLLSFARRAKEKVFFVVSARNTIFAPALIHFDFRFVADVELARVRALRVINVDAHVCSFARQEKAFAHHHFQSRHLATNQAYLLVQHHRHVEHGVVNDGSDG